ncbi:MAG: FHA domain-containing protein [Archangium sp.]|nr:FHA domain-containing protein [Archangium sp.]MDP3152667.1 FHA domain-containing protein [Archangium sp.]MDP3574803.1 FHA domain-containing protein [Archangium sp.]
MKTFTVSPELQSALEKMSRDMAVSVEGLVNQAVFNWAKLHGYVEPGQQPQELEEPETSRVPVVDDVESDWRLASGGSFSSPRLDPVVPDSTAPSLSKQQRLVLVLAEREVVIDGARFLVGRDVSCDLTIDSPRISRQHAVLHVLDERVEVEDLGSSNGTWYQDQRIDKRTLVHGDEVFFGDTSVRIEFR